MLSLCLSCFYPYNNWSTNLFLECPESATTTTTTTTIYDDGNKIIKCAMDKLFMSFHCLNYRGALIYELAHVPHHWGMVPGNWIARIIIKYLFAKLQMQMHTEKVKTRMFLFVFSSGVPFSLLVLSDSSLIPAEGTIAALSLTHPLLGVVLVLKSLSLFSWSLLSFWGELGRSLRSLTALPVQSQLYFFN